MPTPTTDTAAPPHPRLIPAFAEAIRSVFATMAAAEVTTLPPRPKADAAAQRDASGIIGFSGALAGSVVLCFPTATAGRVVAAFAGAEHPVGSRTC